MKKILIVDDEDVILDTYQEMLSDKYNVDVCNNPMDVLAMCKDNQYDVVVTDYNMHGMDGLTLSNAIVNEIGAKIIMMTGNVDTQYIEDNPNVSGIVIKPVMIKTLKAEIETVLNKV